MHCNTLFVLITSLFRPIFTHDLFTILAGIAVILSAINFEEEEKWISFVDILMNEQFINITKRSVTSAYHI